ncbi:Nitrogen regulatory protein P-II [Ruminococcus sp. YRD2003]|nr:Nitrogen regulatory protein P-II [Ruminococcus flavefaciens]
MDAQTIISQVTESTNGVVFGVWFLDYVLHIDDPVGAVAVHMMNGIWGTIAVGLFANPEVPAYSLADRNGEQLAGLFYGDGKMFIYDIENVIKIRTGEEGYNALHDSAEWEKA